jgi:hypothetical protein
MKLIESGLSEFTLRAFLYAQAMESTTYSRNEVNHSICATSFHYRMQFAVDKNIVIARPRLG